MMAALEQRIQAGSKAGASRRRARLAGAERSRSWQARRARGERCAQRGGAERSRPWQRRGDAHGDRQRFGEALRRGARRGLSAAALSRLLPDPRELPPAGGAPGRGRRPSGALGLSRPRQERVPRQSRRLPPGAGAGRHGSRSRLGGARSARSAGWALLRRARVAPLRPRPSRAGSGPAALRQRSGLQEARSAGELGGPDRSHRRPSREDRLRGLRRWPRCGNRHRTPARSRGGAGGGPRHPGPESHGVARQAGGSSARRRA
jgi:hypothetical protein